MTKLALFALPLIVAACVDRELATAPPAETAVVSETPLSPSPVRGRGEGERESYEASGVSEKAVPTTGGPSTFERDASPADGNAMGAGDGTTFELPGDRSNAERSMAGSSDLILDESGVGFGGQSPVPASELGGEPRDPRIDMMPADFVDAGPGMIP